MCRFFRYSLRVSFALGRCSGTGFYLPPGRCGRLNAWSLWQSVVAYGFRSLAPLAPPVCCPRLRARSVFGVVVRAHGRVWRMPVGLGCGVPFSLGLCPSQPALVCGLWGTAGLFLSFAGGSLLVCPQPLPTHRPGKRRINVN